MKTFKDRCGLTGDLDIDVISEKYSIIESCLDAVNEEVKSNIVFSTLSRHTHSSFYELLDSVKDMLYKLASHVLSLLNNSYINQVKLLSKYREIVIPKVKQDGRPFIHKTYEYPVDRGKIVPGVISASYITKDVERLHKQILSDKVTSGEVGFFVDNLLVEFGRNVTGYIIDPYDIANTVKRNITESYRGRESDVMITEDTISSWIDSINNYNEDRKMVMELRDNINDQYLNLKSVYGKVTRRPKQYIENSAEHLLYPERDYLIASEKARFSDIHVEMMRLFNGYIKVYQEAFKTKLSLMEDKINDQRNTINEIFIRTGIFAKLAKEKVQDSRVISYNPKLMT